MVSLTLLDLFDGEPTVGSAALAAPIDSSSSLNLGCNVLVDDAVRTLAAYGLGHDMDGIEEVMVREAAAHQTKQTEMEADDGGEMLRVQNSL